MIAVGVDTHKHEYLARALDGLGQPVGGLQIEASLAGYLELVDWLRGFGEEVLVGIEGSGSFGAGLCEFLPRAGDQGRGGRTATAPGPPPGQVRRDRRAGSRQESPRRRRALHPTRGRPPPGALCAACRLPLLRGRAHAATHQLQSLHTSAPVALRERIGTGNGEQLATRLSRMRSRSAAPEAEQLVLTVLRDLARRTRELEAQARAYERELRRLIDSLDPTLLDGPGVGPISAAKLLASDPRRLKSEAAFARCNGTAPNPASSGQKIRHRLDRGGDRQANCALYTIALNRSVYDHRTRLYLERAPARARPTRSHARAQTTPLAEPLQTAHHRALDSIEASPRPCKRACRQASHRSCDGRDPGAASRATPALAPCWRAGVAGGRRTSQDSQRDFTSEHVIHHPSRREPSRAVPTVCIHEAASVASEPVAPSLGGAAAHAHPRRRRPRGATLGGWRGSRSAARGGASEGHPRHRGDRRRRVPPPQAPRADTSLPKAMAAHRRPHP